MIGRPTITPAVQSAVPVLLLALAAAGCGEDDSPQAAPRVRHVDGHPAHEAARRVEAAESLPDSSNTTRSIARTPAAMTGTNEDAPAVTGRYLIVHADDVGLCDSVNRATIAALEEGVISAASIMGPCPAFEEFADYASRHPEYDYGIHLTLNAEFQTYRWGPVLGADAVPSLVDSRGYLWAEEHQTAAHARADDVERELTAQIERALERNIPISHLDSHMGTLFTRPDFLEIYVNLGLKYDLPILITRGGRDLSMFTTSRELKARVDEIVETLDKNGLPVLDHVVMHYAADSVQQKRRYYGNAFERLPAGVSEVIVHLGYNDRSMRQVTLSPAIRDNDRQAISDPSLAERISRLGIRVINWKQFRGMNARRTTPATSLEQTRRDQ